MKKLIFTEPDGRWGVEGMNENNQDEKMYAVAWKLKDYEATGLNPDEVYRLKENAVSAILSKLREQQEELQEQINTNAGDTYNRLNLMKRVNDIETAVKVIEHI